MLATRINRNVRSPRKPSIIAFYQYQPAFQFAKPRRSHHLIRKAVFNPEIKHMNMNQLFDQFVGGNSGNTASGQKNTGGISDTLANAVPSGLANKLPGGLTGGVAGGLAAGGLMGLLIGNKKVRKKAGKLAGGAVGLGGAAALGALAFSAYQKWQSGNAQASGHSQPGEISPPPNAGVPPVGQVENRAGSHIGSVPVTQVQTPPSPESFNPATATAADGQPFQLALLKAMIAAANADGHIDSDEQKNIFDAVDKVQLGAEEKAFIFDTLRNPPSIEMIASLANGLEQASEIYLASVLAIDLDDPSEQAYLDALAEQLALPPGFTAHLEHQINQTNRAAA